MNVSVISYSFTGNNDALASSIADAISAAHIRITETKPRTMMRIIFDMIFNSTPDINFDAVKIKTNDLLIFIGPVWMGKVATPLRACFKKLNKKPTPYVFVSISGGADGENARLSAELTKRMQIKPLALIDMHIADLLPDGPKSLRKDTMDYVLTDKDIKNLTDTVLQTLESMRVLYPVSN